MSKVTPEIIKLIKDSINDLASDDGSIVVRLKDQVESGS